MSVSAEPNPPTGFERTASEEESGGGWLLYAALLLVMLGGLNLVEGIAAIDKSRFFTQHAEYIIGSLNTWGWVALCFGVIQIAVGLGVFFRSQVARWLGVVILGLNAIAQLLMIPAYPLWSLAIFAVDVLATYGLLVHGTRAEAGNW